MFGGKWTREARFGEREKIRSPPKVFLICDLPPTSTLGNLYKNPPSRQVLTARWDSFREKRWWRNQLDRKHLQVIGWVAHLVTLFYSFERTCSSQPWGNLWPLYLTGGTFSLGKLVNMYLQKTLIAIAALPRGWGLHGHHDKVVSRGLNLYQAYDPGPLQSTLQTPSLTPIRQFCTGCTTGKVQR